MLVMVVEAVSTMVETMVNVDVVVRVVRIVDVVLRKVRMDNYTGAHGNSPESVNHRWVGLCCYRRTDDGYGRSDGLWRDRLDWH